MALMVVEDSGHEVVSDSQASQVGSNRQSMVQKALFGEMKSFRPL
jgi:hypothetical protein